MTGANPRISVEVEATTGKLTTQLNAASKSIQDFGNKTKVSLDMVNAAYDKTSKNVHVGGNKYVEVNEQMAEAAAAAAKAQRLQTLSMQQGTVETAKFGSGLTKAFSGLRTIAYILPGIGIAGIFNLAYEAIGKAADKLGLFKEQIDIAKVSLDDFANSIGASREASLRASQQNASDVTTLKLLYDAYTNTSLSIQARRQAFDELQELYPAYFGNLKFEKEETDALRAIYDKLNNSIIQSGKARAIADLIAQKEGKQALNREKLYSLEIRRQKEINDLRAAAEAEPGNLRKNSFGDWVSSGGLVGDALERVRKTILEIAGLTGQNAKLTAEEKRLQDDYNVSLEQGAKLTQKIGEAPKQTGKTKAELLKELTELWESMLVKTAEFSLENRERFLKSLSIKHDKETILAGWEEMGKAIEATMGAHLVKPNLYLKDSLSMQLQVLEDFNKDAERLIRGDIVNTFAGIGDAIAESLSNGANLGATLGQALLASLGSVLGQLGQLAIATGVAISGIKIALKTLNPVVAIAAGTALLAISGVVKRAASKIGDNMDSGGGGGSSYSTSPNPASVSSGGQMTGTFSGGNVVFEIAGTKLIGVLNNAGYALSRVQNRRI